VWSHERRDPKGVACKGLAELLEEAGEDALGHAPDDCVLQLIGSNQTGIPGNAQADKVKSAGVKKMVETHPTRRCYFRIEPQHRGDRHQEYEGPHGYRWEDRSARHYVIKASGPMLESELNSDFLPSLPHGGAEEIQVARLAATSWKSHMTGPGIPPALSPPDQEDTIGFRSEDDGDRSPEERCIVVGGGLVASEALAEASQPGGQCECDWQPPPQQPPLEGGPSRL
jgi:hypothetical protein